LMNLTAKAGMEHYEISNFARPGFRSRHNSSYWTGQPYIGLGAGAHSYDGDRLRSYNCEDIKGYIQSIGRSECPSTTEQLDEDARYNERVMLSLRTAEGLSLTNLERDFGKARKEYCENMAKAHIQRGSIKKTGENLCLTRRALFVSDDIISDLMV
ncbi:MAG: coproporphyrinogen III oxidase, partial [Bacteroidaceae bacterium]|nr:coproporphyrinogen III oxidase [Bacteroidaceae bacterium]